MGVIIETPWGSIVHTGDLKLDHIDGVPTEAEETVYENAFKNANVLMLMADSTNVENPGFSMPEKQVHKKNQGNNKKHPRPPYCRYFSSLLERILKIIEFAEKYGKKVCVEGRSMKQNVDM